MRTLNCPLHARQMEKQTADASYFLPSYDLRQCTAAVTELKQEIESLRDELLPKRKFAFSKKVSRVKGSALSSTAAEANPAGAAPISAGGTSALAGAACLAGSQSATDPSGATTSYGTPRDIALVDAGSGLRGLRNQVIVLPPEQIRNQDFVLIDLQGCRIYLLGHMPALRMLGLRDCTVVAGPVTGERIQMTLHYLQQDYVYFYITRGMLCGWLRQLHNFFGCVSGI